MRFFLCLESEEEELLLGDFFSKHEDLCAGDV